MKISNHRDFWAGLLFTAIGLAFAAGATQYALGTGARPGPGYFPLGLGLLLALLGAGVLAKSVALGSSGPQHPDGEAGESRVGAWAWRPLLVICCAVVIFGKTLPLLGLFCAMPVLVLLTGTAVQGFTWTSVLIAAVVLTLACWLIFVLGLGLLIPLWPSMLVAA